MTKIVLNADCQKGKLIKIFMEDSGWERILQSQILMEFV